MSPRRTHSPFSVGLGGLGKGKYIKQGDRWVWMSDNDIENRDIIRKYTEPDSSKPIKPPSEELSSTIISPEGNTSTGTPLAGRYQSPSYLTARPVEPTLVKTAPLPTPGKTLSEIPKLVSVAPRDIPKPDSPQPRAVSVSKTCSLCSGPIKDGQCTKCSSKQCPGCGEMNFSLSTNCLRCGKELKK